MQLDPETLAWQTSIQRSKVEHARAQVAGTKLLEGARLFDVVRLRILCGIRTQYPDWAEADVEAEFCRRLDSQRRRNDRDIYTVIGEIETT